MDFYRAWCDVGTEDEPLTDEEHEASKEEVRRVCAEECDAMHEARQPTAATTTPDGQPF
jgi:hypothetical protein